VSDRKNPLEQAFELFVYAPLGLLFNAEEVIPQLIEKGKQQVTMARMFGELAVQQGQTEASKAISKVQEQATEVVEQLGGRRNHQDPPAPAPARAPASSAPASAEAPAPAAPASSPATTPSGPAVATLAIPDYDSLSASQVVPRLEGLSGAELDAVRAYEAGHRGRKTILNKISQLQG
jgi:pyruvate/2-oxoglutarate dehydrogenase complex dihydrolipoamide acyltransferase (E2) component